MGSKHCKRCGVRLSAEWHELASVCDDLVEVCEACELVKYRQECLVHGDVEMYEAMLEVACDSHC
jgi:hypothetical protein